MRTIYTKKTFRFLAWAGGPLPPPFIFSARLPLPPNPFNAPPTACNTYRESMLRPGSEFFHPGSRVKNYSESRIRIHIKEFKYCWPKKLFLSSRKYDPASSRIWIPDTNLDFFTHPGSRGQKGRKRPWTVPMEDWRLGSKCSLGGSWNRWSQVRITQMRSRIRIRIKWKSG